MRLFILLVCTLIIFGCGIPEDKGDGFVSDFNKCEWAEADGYYNENLTKTSDQNLKNASSTTYLGQEFSISDTKQFWGVSVFLKTTATVGSGISIKAYIYEDSAVGTTPSVTEVGYSESHTISTADTTGSWVNIQFDQVPHMDADTDYWLVLKGLYTANGSQYVIWSHSGSGTAFKSATTLEGSWASITGTAAYKFMACR